MTLTAPAHLRGRIGATKCREKVNARRTWIAAQAQAGHSPDDVARALGLSADGFRKNFRGLFSGNEVSAPPAKPDRTDRATLIYRGGGHHGADRSASRISLARAPWDDAEVQPDPRRETEPRDGTKVSSRGPDRAAIVIAALRAELGRADHAESM